MAKYHLTIEAESPEQIRHIVALADLITSDMSPEIRDMHTVLALVDLTERVTRSLNDPKHVARYVLGGSMSSLNIALEYWRLFDNRAERIRARIDAGKILLMEQWKGINQP